MSSILYTKNRQQTGPESWDFTQTARRVLNGGGKRSVTPLGEEDELGSNSSFCRAIWIACATPSMGVTATRVTACKLIECWHPRFLIVTDIGSALEKSKIMGIFQLQQLFMIMVQAFRL